MYDNHLLTSLKIVYKRMSVYIYVCFTGLHVENHGVVGNYMYNEKTGYEFELLMNNADTLHPDWWNSAEPFFITAEKQVNDK